MERTLKVSDVVSCDKVVWTIRSNQTLDECLNNILLLHIRHVPVVDNGKLVGVISDRDLRLAAASPLLSDTLEIRRRLRETNVEKMMSLNPVTCDEEMPVLQATKLMIEKKIGAMPVLNKEGQLVGMLSYVDLLKTLTGLLEKTECVESQACLSK